MYWQTKTVGWPFVTSENILNPTENKPLSFILYWIQDIFKKLQEVYSEILSCCDHLFVRASSYMHVSLVCSYVGRY